MSPSLGLEGVASPSQTQEEKLAPMLTLNTHPQNMN